MVLVAPIFGYRKWASARPISAKLELIINAKANKVGIEFDVDVGTDNRCECRILQVDKQILDPCGPVVGEGAFAMVRPVANNRPPMIQPPGANVEAGPVIDGRRRSIDGGS